MSLFRQFFLISLLFFIALPSVHASTKNGYYHKEIGVNFTHYDAMAKFGTPTIDGVLSVGEWDTHLARDQYKYDRDDNRIRYLFQYDNNNFYILIDVDDDKLWDDEPLTTGTNGLATWVTWQDDGVEIFLDPNNSRDAVLTNSDRLIAFSIQSRHYRFDVGNNVGSTDYFGNINLIKKAVGIRGTVNNNSDVDQGYTVEVAIPWNQLGITPVPFSFISTNILILEDDDGGELSSYYNVDATDQPYEIDRYFSWFGDGIKGPANYARIYLLPAQDTTAPAPITNFSASQIQPFSAILSFSATGDDGYSGQAKHYVIRYTTDGVTTEYNNQFVPKIAGQVEQVRLLGLQANKAYAVEISAEDYAGNRSAPVFTAFNTPSAADDYGKGRIYPSPMGRYFVHENGQAFLPVTQATGINWVGIRDLYARPLWEELQHNVVNWSTATGIPDEQKAEQYLKKLSKKGINLVRIFIEDMAFADSAVYSSVPYPDGIAWLEYPYGQYIPETLQFLDNFMSLCAKYNIYVTLTPWDNYFYRADIFHSHPYNVTNGGPITERDQFVTDLTARAGQKQRLTTLSWIVNKHANFFGWEMMNEWDNNTFASRDDATGSWQPIRIEWMKDLVTHLRAIDSERMIFISSVIEQPQGIVKDFTLQSNLFDFVSIHNYTAGVGNPLKSGDSNPSIRAALDSNRIIRYQLGNTVDYRPIFDLEFGPIEVKSSYSGTYSQTTDEETFHTILWSEVGSGAAGMPLRWPCKVLEFRGPQLTEQMWDYQENMAQFFANTQINFAQFSGIPWQRYVSFVNGNNLKPFAFSDGKQGLIYVLQDVRFTTPFVSGAVVTVNNLSYDGQYQVEFWDTRAKNAKIERTEATANAGQMNINLPAFNNDLMVTFAVKNAITPQNTTLPSLGNGIMLGGQATNSQFSGAVSVNGQSTAANVVANTSQPLKITANITIAPEHVGQVADVLFVIGSEVEPPYDATHVIYTAFDQAKISKVVDLTVPQGLVDLTSHPFMSGATLSNNLSLELWNDVFDVASMNYVFFGYRLSDGTLVYNQQPLLIKIQ